MNPTGKFGKRTLVTVILTGAVSLAVANADVGPYETIVKRNPFGLNPPPPPKPVVVEPPKPPSDVVLTGITSLFGGIPKAYLVTKDPKGVPEYHTLAIGERSGSLEVLDIDSGTGTVKIKNGFSETTLNFKDNGNKTAAAPPPAPGAPGIPGQPRPVGIPVPTSPIPTRTSSAPSSPTTSINLGAPAAPTTAAPASDSPLRSLPTRSLRTSVSGSQAQDTVTVPHPPQANVTAEESAVIMAVTKEVNKVEIQKGNFPPLPPVPGADE